MNKAIISFVVSVLVGFGLGYLVNEFILSNDSGSQPKVASSNNAASQSTAKDESSTQSTDKQEAAKTVSANQDNILQKRGCLSCHSVGALNLKGGQVGPDLSKAYVEVQDKHGMPIEKFLTKPNSAVMSGVIGKDPLTNDQRKQVIEILKKASETKQ